MPKQESLYEVRLQCYNGGTGCSRWPTYADTGVVWVLAAADAGLGKGRQPGESSRLEKRHIRVSSGVDICWAKQPFVWVAGWPGGLSATLCRAMLCACRQI
jgi:hypothetical protein